MTVQTVLISINLALSIALEVFLKLTLLYIACWYLFKVPAIAIFVSSKKTLGQIIILYAGIVTILVTTHSTGDSWKEPIYISLLLGLLIITVSFLAHQRLKTYM